MKKSYYQKLTRCNNSVDAAASRFGKGCPNKHHFVRKMEIPDAIFARELKEYRERIFRERKDQ